MGSGRGWQPDYEKGILWQIATSKNIDKNGYVQFVKEGKVFFNPAKEALLFETEFLEFFTKTPWYVIPIIWLPIASYHLMEQGDQIATLFAFVFGFFLWTFMEYMIHRFIFHGETTWL